MAPQRHGNGLPPWMTEDDDDDNEDASQPSTTLFEVPVETGVETDADAPIQVLVENPFYPATMPQYPPVPTALPSNIPDRFSKARPRPYDRSSAISTSTTSSEFSQQPIKTTSSKASIAIATADVTQTTSIDANGFPGGWRNRGQDHHSRAPIYAAAAVVPVAILAIIGAILFVCLRRRKRRRSEAATAAVNVREMKAHSNSKPTTEPYMAPSPLPSAVLPNYYPPISARPIILGPIPSGTNGAYLTGIDTSDMVSVISANQFRTSMADPLADGRSLEEPPPPYRPRSMARSSICPTSRHSSVRVSAHPPATSQTHLIERSPFDDPEDDNISELSGSTIRRGTDAASAVSDLSYQLDPVVGRSSL